MNIDIDNLEKLTVIIEELGSSLRDRVLQVTYTPEELAQTHELVRRINSAAKWTLNYFDYYETYRESNPIIMLVEMDNIQNMENLTLAAENDQVESIFDRELEQ